MPTSAELLNNLYQQYTSVKSRPVRTDEQRRAQATNEYKSYYDALRLAAQQGYDKSDLALKQQQQGLQASYDRQREASAKQYAQSYSQADRQMLSRGMQRSTYGSQILAGISNEGAKAQQSIQDEQTRASGDIDAQRSQLAQQLTDQMKQYEAGQQSDILKRIAELEEQDRQYTLTETSAMQGWAADLYKMLKDQEDTAAKSSGGGGSRKSSSSKSTAQNSGTPTQTMDSDLYNKFMSGLNFNPKKTSGVGEATLDGRVNSRKEFVMAMR